MRIALYLKNLDEEYQISVYQGVRKEALALGIELICIQGDTLNRYLATGVSPFPMREFMTVDGILLLSSVIVDRKELVYRPEIERIFGGIPCVSIGNRLFDFPSIVIRTRTSMEEIMDHLITFHGYRKLLFIGGPETHPDNALREHVFRRSINSCLPRFPELEGTVINGGFSEITGRGIVRDYIKDHPQTPPDAIVAANDNMAIGALKALRMADDPRWRGCAVTGFDDIPEAELEVPALTTVHQPLNALGQIAVRTIRDLVAGEMIPSVIHVDSSVRLRASCGCAPERDHSNAGDAASLREQIQRIQYLQIQSDQHVRNVRFFGQELTTVESLGGLIEHLRTFLNEIGNRAYFLLLYPQSAGGKGDGIQLAYERFGGTDRSYADAPRTVSLRDFFGPGYPPPEGRPTARCIYHLMSGPEMIGLILYEAEDSAHLHICSSAIFIANTVKRLRILDDEKERSRQLEREVSLRTMDLVETNKKLKKEARRRIAVEAEVLRISEMERLRFSLDLHDDICQRLAGISMFSRSLGRNRGAGASDAGIGAGLTELSDMIDETLHRTRQYAHDSFPMELDSLGLNGAFSRLCHETEERSGLACVYAWSVPEGIALSAAQEINLYRIVQEAIHNVVEHAKASRIDLTVETVEGVSGTRSLTVRVRDDGIGNPRIMAGEPGAAKAGARRGSAGIGLRSMEYRSHQIGAGYRVESSERGGTLVEIGLPLNGEAPPEEGEI